MLQLALKFGDSEYWIIVLSNSYGSNLVLNEQNDAALIHTQYYIWDNFYVCIWHNFGL